MNNAYEKKSLPAALAFVLMLILSLSLGGRHVQAHPSQGGGFTGPGPTLVSAAQAESMGAGTHVSLRGYIIQSLGDEKYTFKDDSGAVTVEIDNHKWGDLKGGPADLVEIHGEVGMEWTVVSTGRTFVEIDVDRVIKAQ